MYSVSTVCDSVYLREFGLVVQFVKATNKWRKRKKTKKVKTDMLRSIGK